MSKPARNKAPEQAVESLHRPIEQGFSVFPPYEHMLVTSASCQTFLSM